MRKRMPLVILGIMVLGFQPVWAKSAASKEDPKLASAKKAGKPKAPDALPEVLQVTQTPEMTKEERLWGLAEAKRREALANHAAPADHTPGKKDQAEEKKETILTNGAVDYTKGLGPEVDTPERAMGPTGIFGVVPKTEPRTQILVNEVFQGSPARGANQGLMDGRIRPFDVILGVVSPKVPGLAADGSFTGEAQRVFAAAITEAEKTENGGKLVLKVWRPKTEYIIQPHDKRPAKVLAMSKPLSAAVVNVELPLRVMGSYSPTSPWNCEKSEKIIELVAESIASEGFRIGSGAVQATVKADDENAQPEAAKGAKKVAAAGDEDQGGGSPDSGEGGDPEGQDAGRDESEQFKNGVDDYLDALGLLATGNKKYLPMLQEYARSMIEKGKNADIMNPFHGGGTWYLAYRLLFLTEYYLASQDKEVLPAITGFSRYLAMGVSGVGTWSHNMADVRGNGMYGPPCAYGAMNQVSEVATMSLLLAQKCGVKDSYVNKAVAMGLDFYKYYVDKGVIPYGDHPPVLDRRPDVNGRMSIAAVLYDLAERKPEAEYFTRMSVMSHATREGGHTGHFFAWQWGAPGAARGGQEAASAFCKSIRYWTELGRRHDGSSKYQPEMEKDHLKTGNFSTRGAWLVEHCLPRQAIHVTGKGGSVVTPIVGDELKMLMAAGEFNPKKATDAELLQALSHYSAVIRNDAAEEIGKRDLQIVPQLLTMLKSDNRFARYGALQGLKYVGRRNNEAMELCVNIMENDNDWVARFFATDALVPMRTGGRRPTPEESAKPLGPLAKSYTKRIMQMIVRDYPGIGYEAEKYKGQLAFLLFGQPGGEDGVYFPGNPDLSTFDRELLAPMMEVLMTHPHGSVRTAVSNMLPLLSKTDLDPIWGPLYYGITHKAPTGVMFDGGLNAKGNGVMAKYHIKEGLPVTIDYIFKQEGWGNFKRKRSITEVADYGQHLAPYAENFPRKSKAKKDVKAALEKIKTTPPPELVSIEKQIKEFQAKMAAEKEKTASPSNGNK